MAEEIILVGGFHEIVELCEDAGYTIIGIIDNQLKDRFMGYLVLGTDSDAAEIFDLYPNVPLVISPDAPAVRKKLYNYYNAIGFRFATIISPESSVSRSAVIGQGTIIQARVNVSANCRIEQFVKLNTGCNVMHDCQINSFVTVAPDAVILGRVIVGADSYIGANSTILPNLKTATAVTVGAGAVLTKSIAENNSVFAGVPARRIKK